MPRFSAELFMVVLCCSPTRIQFQSHFFAFSACFSNVLLHVFTFDSFRFYLIMNGAHITPKVSKLVSSCFFSEFLSEKGSESAQILPCTICTPRLPPVPEMYIFHGASRWSGHRTGCQNVRYCQIECHGAEKTRLLLTKHFQAPPFYNIASWAQDFSFRFLSDKVMDSRSLQSRRMSRVSFRHHLLNLCLRQRSAPRRRRSAPNRHHLCHLRCQLLRWKLGQGWRRGKSTQGTDFPSSRRKKWQRPRSPRRRKRWKSQARAEIDVQIAVFYIVLSDFSGFLSPFAH